MRKLIFIQSGDNNSVNPCLDQLQGLDWEIFPTTEASLVSALIAEHDIALGLVLIDNPVKPRPDLEAIVLENNMLEWIALVTPGALQESDMRALIGNVFHDYHTLPLDRERLLMTLGHAYGKAALRRQRPAPRETPSYHQLVGTSRVMQRLYDALQKSGETDVPVLITGESGTGKELAARAIHRLSSRARKPFVAVNCAAIPTHLIQSELFGHEKGAFTGAHQRKIGRLEAAAGGTIFLDEIGDLSLDHQSHLLRFLQDKVVERLGSTVGNYVDVRVICATNIDLEQAVAEGRFREDLYYRINVLRLKMPPLREREDDVKLLAQIYFEKFTKDTRKASARGFSQQSLAAMRAYHWPGNVRELTNRVRCAIIMSKKRLITPADLGLEQYLDNVNPHHGDSLDRVRSGAEHELIRSTLRCNGNNMSQTARQLGISRATLYRKLSKFPQPKNA